MNDTAFLGRALFNRPMQAPEEHVAIRHRALLSSVE
jgi:hypothetical protein